jgi:hypothetical protein
LKEGEGQEHQCGQSSKNEGEFPGGLVLKQFFGKGGPKGVKKSRYHRHAKPNHKRQSTVDSSQLTGKPKTGMEKAGPQISADFRK